MTERFSAQHAATRVRNLSSQMSDLMKQANIKAAKHQEDKERIVMYHSRQQIDTIQCHHRFNLRSSMTRSVLNDSYPLQKSARFAPPPFTDIIPIQDYTTIQSPNSQFIYSIINTIIISLFFFTLVIFWTISSIKDIQFYHNYVMETPPCFGISPISEI